MKLRFKQQQYQTDAAMAVVNCFLGQKKTVRRDIIGRYGMIDEISFSNPKIRLTENELRDNVRNVQKMNDIPIKEFDSSLNFSIEMETGTGKTYTYIKTMYELDKHYGWNKYIIIVPSIAIREGVYKSFQITEEHFKELYGKKIRYFVYDSKNSSNIANINTFASESSIQVMIINYQAFNSKSTENRKIYEELDEMQSKRPIDVIKSVNPILIIDEPQKIGKKTEELLKEFNPLFTLRYSATHKQEFNKIYRLDAIDAYNQKLVKKISVKGIDLKSSTGTNSYIFLDSIDISSKHDPIARMEIEVKRESGIKRELRLFRAGDNLYELSNGLEQYKGFVISEIDGRYENYDKVYFTNGVEIATGQAIGNVDINHIRRIQIRETIRSHFEKEKELFKLGIKVLSLFFIDEVAKYKYYDEDGTACGGEYAQIFEEEYVKVLNEYRNFIDEEYLKYLDSLNTRQVHAGYFSIDKKGRIVDSIINDKKEGISFDEDAYELIMRDKERLLSFSEPVRFIFSHSALREGWDNPNIFQICTLKQSNSYISKRQEVGRGLRICVNQLGERMDYSALESKFHNVNTLTIVASESYESFSKTLQEEISETLTERPKELTPDVLINRILKNEVGEEFVFDNKTATDFVIFNRLNGYIDEKYYITDKFIEDLEKEKLEVMPLLNGFEKEVINLMKKIYYVANEKLVTDARKTNIPNLKPNANFYKKEFQELWNNINVKTVYEVDFNSDELVDKCIESINRNLVVSKIKVSITVGEQKEQLTDSTVRHNEMMEVTKTYTDTLDSEINSSIKYDLVGAIADETSLTRKTIVKILQGIDEVTFMQYKINPEDFIKKVSKLINDEKTTTLVNGIIYKKTEQKYDNEIFTINNINAELGENAIDVKKHIYDFLVTDSKNEQEFAKALENGEVTVYAKLPSDFKIPTPVGNYTPDWAIVFDNPTFKYIYFIAETKGSMESLQLRGVEKAKIEYAKKHFVALSNNHIRYDVVDSYESLIEMITK